jgi:hypothetical protein
MEELEKGWIIIRGQEWWHEVLGPRIHGLPLMGWASYGGCRVGRNSGWPPGICAEASATCREAVKSGHNFFCS